MPKTLKEIYCSIGTYTDKDGNKKERKYKVGAIINTQNGEMIKFDVIPTNWHGWAKLEDPKPRYQGLPKDDDFDF